jgi:hypothetical protein
MSFLAPLRRHAAVLAVAAGFGVFGVALGGMATVDDNLRAVAPLDTSSEFVRVSDTSGHHRGGRDCDREDRSARDLNQEL